MKWDGDALGFIPVGGPDGMTRLIDTGHVTLATAAREIIGYAAWTTNHDQTRIKIHQLCVDDAWRLCGIGIRLLDAVQRHEPDAFIACTVRSDLPANDFWTAAGFTKKGERPHKSSGSTLIDYERQSIHGV
jgi:ribosomal protein S18 acetylase RimI-like enzyme